MGSFSFKLPDLGEGIVESEVVEWYVQVGDLVSEDQHIADVMTDKATVEVTSPVTGTVSRLACPAGDMLAVGAELIHFGTEGESQETETNPEPDLETDAIPAPITAVTPNLDPDIPANKVNGEAREGTLGWAGIQTSSCNVETAPEQKREPFSERQILASPSVRLLARNLNINLALVPGTGRNGHITHQDVDDYVEAHHHSTDSSTVSTVSKQEKTATRDIPIKGLRRVIAKRMQETKRNIPHYSYIEEVDVTALEEIRQQLNAQRESHQAKLTLLPFLIQALVKVLPDFSHCNARFDDDNNILTEYEAVHMGIATMTEAGLMVPVIKHCEAMDIWQTAAELERATQAARDGNADKSALSGSTITLTSLGALGGLATTPVINAPETSIIGVNKLQERAIVKNGDIVIRKMMNLSSSFDHRIVDGFDGAQLIQALKAVLEKPATILA